MLLALGQRAVRVASPKENAECYSTSCSRVRDARINRSLTIASAISLIVKREYAQSIYPKREFLPSKVFSIYIILVVYPLI